MLKIISILVLLSGLTFIAHGDEVSQQSRVYHSLEAKKISIRTGVRMVPALKDASSFADFKAIGWDHFDDREWVKATNAFLSALEQDPESEEVAEALSMSLYRSGDYKSAYRLGQELLRIMPSVAYNISQTVAADARCMVKQGEFATAQEFLAHFPASDPSYAKTHQLVSDAAIITAAVGPTGDWSIEPTDAARKGFVKN